jgi:hypothetical protein
MAFQPVVGRAVAVLVEGFLFSAFVTIKLRTFEQDFADAENHRAVRIVDGLALGVMLAVDGGPGLGGHTGGAPQPEAKKMTDDGM